VVSPVEDGKNMSIRREIFPLETNPEIFNIRAINNIREVETQTGKALLPSILDGFKIQMQIKLIEISDYFDAGDSEKIYKTAHAIKSMSANIGAEKVRAISASMELNGRDGSICEIPKAILELSTAYEEFVEQFESRFIPHQSTINHISQ